MFQAQLNIDGLAHVAELHKGGSCSIQHVIDGEWFEGLSKPFEQIAEEVSFLPFADDTYLTQQSIIPFKKRCVDNVCKLGSYWVDLDCYNVGLSKEEALTNALNIISDLSLPKPRMIADSGRGLYLIWVLARPISTKKSVKNRSERIAAWQNTEKLLIDAFKSVGADPKASDPARVLRLAGSVNSKSASTVNYWQSGNKLKSFSELSTALQAIQPDIKPKAKAKPVKKRADQKTVYAVNRIRNRYTLAANRMADIQSLATLRGGLLTDYRERAIYIYAVEAAYFCRERTTLLNNISQFISDCLYLSDNKYNAATPEKYIKAVLDRCEVVGYAAPTFKGDARYKQKTATVIEWLNITEAEQRSLKALISNTERYRRRTHKRRVNGIKERDTYLANETHKIQARKEQAKELRAQGLTLAKIQEQLGVSRVTVHKYLKGTV
jgi:hypothetical protein